MVMQRVQCLTNKPNGVANIFCEIITEAANIFQNTLQNAERNSTFLKPKMCSGRP